MHRQRRVLEAHLEDVLAAAEAEAAHVLVAGPGGAVLEGVAEDMGVAGAQPAVEEQLGDDDPGRRVPADAARAAVLARPQPYPVRVAARVAVVDGDVAVHTVPVRAYDLMRVAFQQLAAGPDTYPFELRDGVRACFAGARSSLMSRWSASPADTSERYERAGGRPVAARGASRAVSASGGSSRTSSRARTARSDSGRVGRRTPCCQ